MTEEEYNKALKKFLIPTLRRASYRWSGRSEALKLARVSRGLYKCAACSFLFGNKDIQLDHIHPIIPLDGIGFTNWDTYIKRLLCTANGYQVLCVSCHGIKTTVENNLRFIARHENKTSKKNIKDKEKMEKKCVKKDI